MQARYISGLVMCGAIVACLAGGSSALGQAGPSWNVGDSWKVGAWHAQVYRRPGPTDPGNVLGDSPTGYDPRGRMVAVDFRVAGVVRVGQTECYEVRVAFPKEETGFERRYAVYYSRETGRLVRVKDFSVKPGGGVKDTAYDYASGAGGPTFVDDFSSLVPLDWLDPVQQDVAPRPRGPAEVSQATVPVTGQDNEVTLVKTAGQSESKVVQRWRQGEPWWRSAKKYDNGRLVAEAVLLEVNGQEVEGR